MIHKFNSTIIVLLHFIAPMINYTVHKLSNGLTLIIHEDRTTPLAVVNVLYKVGSRNEHQDRTGFAHLFEHLMFGGSAHVPDFDKVIHQVGAESNAFTNTDITNYYIVLNASNIETALWVESDRMKYLSIDQAKLDVQKNVVVEEFKQRYLNVPYGDAWLKLRPLAYKTHPYRWPTIGMKIEHIQEATLSDVQSFYDHFYSPDNAVITIAGNVDRNKIADHIDKWFGSFPGQFKDRAYLPKEGIQTSHRFEELTANVPMDAVYKVYHMPARGSKDYVVADLVSDLLGRGQSSRLYRHLVRERQIFNNLNAYITGSADPGLLVITGKLNPGHNFDEAENAIQDEIAKMMLNLSVEEVEKVVNQAASSMYFSETELLNKAIALSMANALGKTDLVNLEMDWIREASKEDLIQGASQILKPANACTLHYRSSK